MLVCDLIKHSSGVMLLRQEKKEEDFSFSKANNNNGNNNKDLGLNLGSFYFSWFHWFPFPHPPQRSTGTVYPIHSTHTIGVKIKPWRKEKYKIKFNSIKCIFAFWIKMKSLVIIRLLFSYCFLFHNGIVL